MPLEGADAHGSFDGALGPVFGFCFLCLSLVAYLRFQNLSYDDLRRLDELKRKLRMLKRLQKARVTGLFVVILTVTHCFGYGSCLYLIFSLALLRMMLIRFPEYSPARLLLESRFGTEHFINENATWFDGLKRHRVTGRFRLRDSTFFLKRECFDWSTIQTVVTYGSNGKVESCVLKTASELAEGPSATLQIFSYCLKPLHMCGEIANFQQYVSGMIQGGYFLLSKILCRRPLDMGDCRSFPEDVDLLVVEAIPRGEDRNFLEKVMKDTGCQFQIAINPMDYEEVCWARRVNLALGKGSLVVDEVNLDWNPKIYLISLPSDEVLNDFVFSERIMFFLTRFHCQVMDLPVPVDDIFDSMWALMLQPDLVKLKTGDLFVFGKLSKYKIIKNNISPFSRRRLGYVYDNGYERYAGGRYFCGPHLNTGLGYWLE